MNDDLPTLLQQGGSGLIPHSKAEGTRWEQLSVSELIGLIGHHGNNIVRDGAAAELHRRTATVIQEFNAQVSSHSARLIALAEETSNQTDKLVTLTKWIIGLTVSLGVIAVLQLAAMVWDIFGKGGV